MSLLDYTNLDYSPQMITPLDSFYFDEFPTEAELICFDPLPPSLFDFDFDFNVPLFPLPPPPIEYHQPPLHPPAPNPYPYYYYDDNNNNNNNNEFVPKRQKLEHVPSFEGDNNSYSNCHQKCAHFCNGGVGKEVTAQSKAARERRRKITEKTQELGKLVPGGTKMNTAHMFQAASNYVKFLQAQLALLNFLNSLPQENDQAAKPNNLSILGSQLIQEKLYSKEKCLVPVDFLPILKRHLDPSISKHIDELLMH
ncbi:hypothetical protein vseg_006401 [Gypsophila vaccaria]